MPEHEPILVACPQCHALNRVAPARLGDGPACGKCRQALFAGAAVALTSASFDAHAVRAGVPVVIDFWAEWCGPCRAMAPAFAQAAQQLEPRVRFAKIDTEAEPALASRHAIRSIPTMVLIHQGRELARQSGAMPAASIVQWVAQQLR